MAKVLADSLMGSLVPPAIWKGYSLPYSVIVGEKCPVKGIIPCPKNVPQQWLDEMINAFKNGSAADFYDKYLGKVFDIQDHEQILVEADEILRSNGKDLPLPQNPIIALASVRVAYNASMYGDHLFQTACFLKEQDQLPKKCQFMFQRKINPAFYEDGKLFKTVEKALSEPAKKIPPIWGQNAFYNWAEKNDDGTYLSQMINTSIMELLLEKNEWVFVDCAVRDYIKDNRERAYQRRPRPSRRSWRGRE